MKRNLSHRVGQTGEMLVAQHLPGATWHGGESSFDFEYGSLLIEVKTKSKPAYGLKHKVAYSFQMPNGHYLPVNRVFIFIALRDEGDPYVWVRQFSDPNKRSFWGEIDEASTLEDIPRLVNELVNQRRIRP